MRQILLFTTTIIVVTLYFIWYPQDLRSGLKIAGDTYESSIDSLLYRKQVNIKGLQNLTEEEIRQNLPVDYSNLWWKMHSTDIASGLKENSFIESVDVESCTVGSWWNCFDVTVSERRPAFIALIGETPWLIGKDGGLMGPLDSQSVSQDKFKAVAADIKNAIVIKGLVDQEYSPDIVESRIALLSKAVATIETAVKWKIKKLEIKPNAEIEILFEGESFKVIMDFEKGDLARIDDQTKRLTRLLLDYRGRYDQIEQIDLAFSKLAVVKLKEQEVLTPPKMEKAPGKTKNQQKSPTTREKARKHLH